MALFALSIMQRDNKPNVVSKASSNLSSEKYLQRFRTKWRSVSPSPTLWWASCSGFEKLVGAASPCF